MKTSHSGHLCQFYFLSYKYLCVKKKDPTNGMATFAKKLLTKHIASSSNIQSLEMRMSSHTLANFYLDSTKLSSFSLNRVTYFSLFTFGLNDRQNIF